MVGVERLVRTGAIALFLVVVGMVSEEPLPQRTWSLAVEAAVVPTGDRRFDFSRYRGENVAVRAAVVSTFQGQPIAAELPQESASVQTAAVPTERRATGETGGRIGREEAERGKEEDGEHLAVAAERAPAGGEGSAMGEEGRRMPEGAVSESGGGERKGGVGLGEGREGYSGEASGEGRGRAEGRGEGGGAVSERDGGGSGGSGRERTSAPGSGREGRGGGEREGQPGGSRGGVAGGLQPRAVDLGLYSLVEETPEMRALRRYIGRRYEVNERQLVGWFKMIDVEAKRYGIDPLLVVAVIAVESEFDPQAVSHQGALGLMQVMPKWHLDRVDERVIGEAEERHLFDPGINISVGAELLAEALERHKSLEQALQYYNGATKDRGRRYARKVLSMYKRLHGIVQRHVAQTGMAGERAPRPAGGGEARG